MIQINLRNQESHTLKIAAVTVVGHAVFVSYGEPAKSCWLNLKDMAEFHVRAARLGIDKLITTFVENDLPATKNWGDDEQDYDAVLTSPNPYLRVLVAMNGKYLDVLSRDTYSLVRLAAVTHILNRNTNSIERDTLLWLDRLVNDPSEWVRLKVAKIGLPHHLDVLVHDTYPMILNAVAEKGQAAHLNHLVTCDDELTRIKMVANLNATSEQIERLSKDHQECVQLAVAEQGFTNRYILKSRFELVRMAAIKYGCNETELATLAYDNSEAIRVALARRGIAHEVLSEDKSAKVKLAVEKNPSYEAAIDMPLVNTKGDSLGMSEPNLLITT